MYPNNNNDMQQTEPCDSVSCLECKKKCSPKKRPISEFDRKCFGNCFIWSQIKLTN